MSAMATMAPDDVEIFTPGGMGATLSPASVIFFTTMPALCSRTGQVFIYVCEYHRHGSDSYWLVASTKIPQDRAAASASASARMADVHSSFRITRSEEGRVGDEC